MPVPDGISETAWAVANFHAQFDLPLRNRPVAPHLMDDEPELRSKLQREETAELQEALFEDNLVGIAKELADVVYVAYGTAITYGIDLDAVLRLVHLSNMSKLGPNQKPLFRDDGKVLKGPNYWPPEKEIRKLLKAQPELPWKEQ